MKLLRTQTIIFSIISVVLFITLLIFFFNGNKLFSMILIISLLMLLLFVYSLWKKKKFAYHYGFLVIILGMIACLWFQVFFNDKILPSLEYSYAIMNLTAIIDVVIISAVLLTLLFSLYVQVKLRKSLV